MSQYKDLLFEVRDGVARITINRPASLNALSTTVFRELGEALDRAAAEERADELMDQGGDGRILEQQMAVYSSWMSNYPMHPVLGRHWTEAEAECVVVTMMQVEGIGRRGARHRARREDRHRHGPQVLELPGDAPEGRRLSETSWASRPARRRRALLLRTPLAEEV